MGLIVSFNYAAGSNPGARRIIYNGNVNSVPSSGTFDGIDMETGEFRRFCRFRMTDIKKEDGYVVHLNQLPDGYNGDTLAQQYENDGKLAYHDKLNKVVVSLPSPIHKSTVPTVFGTKPSGSYVGLEFIKGNKAVQLKIFSNGNVQLVAYDNMLCTDCNNSPTAEHIIKALELVR